MRKVTRKPAFTLAEILISLGIIGVVATLTIPAVVIKSENKQTVLALKKAYISLGEVERAAMLRNGPLKDWDWSLSAPNLFEKYFKPHFDILKDCGNTEASNDCFADKYAYLLNGNFGTLNSTAYYKIMTTDGVPYAYGPHPLQDPPIRGPKGSIFIDINGKKGPNRWGRDLFLFEVFSGHLGIKPRGAYSATQIGKKNTFEYIKDQCVNHVQGPACSALILTEGKISY